jgi:hypothetical protein
MPGYGKAEDLPEVGPRFRLHAQHKVSDLALTLASAMSPFTLDLLASMLQELS